jgi:transglutaminase-like putative cysteine protease
MKKLLTAILVALTIAVNPIAAAAGGTPSFDTSKLDDGIVTISHIASARLKVMVEKDGKKVTYDLKNDGTAETFPLQLGDGSYKVSVLENISGTKYKYVSTQNFGLDLSNDNEVYLASVQNINWNEDMEAIKLAKELTKGLKKDSDKVKKIYEYIVNNIVYDYDKLPTLKSDYVPNIESTLASGTGICYDFSSLFAAMLRSQGIPTKLVKGYSTNVEGYHAWNEVYDSETGTWITIDTTYDSERRVAGRTFSMTKDAAQFTKVYEY